MVKYSLCMTHRNNSKTVEASLDSVLVQIDGSFEVVVVDAESTDGSLEKLRRYSDEGKIKLIVRKCSRGRGRQLAFEGSSGKYIIANVDLDEIYRASLNDMLKFYHTNCEGMVVLNVFDSARNLRGFQNVTVAPADAVREIGGWHDLQYGEDWEFWARAAKAGRYGWTVFPLVDSLNYHTERKTNLNKLRLRFTIYREAARCGRPILREEVNTNTSQRLFVVLASVIAPFYESYRDPFYKVFKCYDEAYRIGS
jgi:glycosyltransferase involved in cell wall biosynthesis